MGHAPKTAIFKIHEYKPILNNKTWLFNLFICKTPELYDDIKKSGGKFENYFFYSKKKPAVNGARAAKGAGHCGDTAGWLLFSSRHAQQLLATALLLD
jgi:hypothetical protein